MMLNPELWQRINENHPGLAELIHPKRHRETIVSFEDGLLTVGEAVRHIVYDAVLHYKTAYVSHVLYRGNSSYVLMR